MLKQIFAMTAVGMLFCAAKTDAQKTQTPLMESKVKGGLTPKGAFFANFVIKRDGSIKFETNTGKKTVKLSKAELTLLTKEINKADYKAITAKKSGKISPAAYDGNEITYIFYAKGRRYEIAPYKYHIPPNVTLLDAVENVEHRHHLFGE